MSAGFGRLRRLVWFIVPLCLSVVWLSYSAHTRAAVNEPVGAAEGSSRVFLPMATGYPPPTVALVPFATGFNTDTIMDIANAGDERLFVVQREGIVRIVWPDGTIDPEPFMDLTDDVTSEYNWEQGLLGIAFHPNYPTTPYIYVAYTSITSLRIGRLTLDPDNPNHVSRGSMRFLMMIKKPVWGDEQNPQPSPVHNAGDLTFGPDSYLYIPLGDGGPDPYVAVGVPGDPFGNSQNRATPLGSILRLDVDEGGSAGPDCGDDFYTIPPGNPFTGDGGCDEIWGLGLRNPWRIDFDPANGTLFVADVGEWHREEINILPWGTATGANYGWNCFEGTVDYRAQWDPEVFGDYFRNCGAREDYTFPVYEYDHSQGECSLTGGVVYRGAKYPYFDGRYLYSDFCSGRIWVMEQAPNGQWSSRQVGQSTMPLTTFGRDAQGEVYAGMRDPNGQDNGDVTLFKVVVK